MFNRELDFIEPRAPVLRRTVKVGDSNDEYFGVSRRVDQAIWKPVHLAPSDCCR